MKIYVSHSGNFDFQNALYKPLRDAKLPVEFVFPHENSSQPFNSKELFENHGCDCVVAEVSNSSTGVGVELGWADSYGIPIICFFKSGTTPANSLEVLTDKILEYSDSSDLVNKLMIELRLNYA